MRWWGLYKYRCRVRVLSQFPKFPNFKISMSGWQQRCIRGGFWASRSGSEFIWMGDTTVALWFGFRLLIGPRSPTSPMTPNCPWIRFGRHNPESARYKLTEVPFTGISARIIPIWATGVEAKRYPQANLFSSLKPPIPQCLGYSAQQLPSLMAATLFIDGFSPCRPATVPFHRVEFA